MWKLIECLQRDSKGLFFESLAERAPHHFHLHPQLQKKKKKNATHRSLKPLTSELPRVLCTNLASTFHGSLTFPAISMCPGVWVSIVVDQVREHGIKYPRVLDKTEQIILLEPTVNLGPTPSPPFFFPTPSPDLTNLPQHTPNPSDPA